MAYLPLGQKPIVMPHYPHMMAEDIDVWTAYLKSPVVPILEVWYDVHVGAGLAGLDPADALGARIARGVYRKRIDVVCRLAAGYWVVEVKPFGSMLALGQALSYTGLFRREYEVRGEVIPVVVCGEVDEDLVDEYDMLGVGLIVV